MVRETLLKENIDGEALLWAYSRLLQERSRTKILFMFTEGMPMDESTLQVQRNDFLQDHFHSIAKRIVAERKVTLKLIGINYDLSNVLADAVEVTESKLADPILNTIRAVINRS